MKKPHDYSPEDGARFIVHFSKARVPQASLPLIADVEFKLVQDETGKYTWAWSNIKGERKREILKMVDEGLDANTIREALGVTRQYVSKVKTQAIDEGYLKSGKLTQSGFHFVSGEDFG